MSGIRHYNVFLVLIEKNSGYASYYRQRTNLSLNIYYNIKCKIFNNDTVYLQNGKCCVLKFFFNQHQIDILKLTYQMAKEIGFLNFKDVIIN